MRVPRRRLRKRTKQLKVSLELPQKPALNWKLSKTMLKILTTQLAPLAKVARARRRQLLAAPHLNELMCGIEKLKVLKNKFND